MNRNFKIVFLLISPLFVSSNHPSYLSQLALVHHSDKSPDINNYTEIYENYFCKFQNKAINFLEISKLKEGCASRRVWDSYFTNPDTRLFFVDLSDNILKDRPYLSSRCVLNKINQYKQEDLTPLMMNTYDIIIDAGESSVDRQMATFQTLFSSLNPGGIYIVEDLFFSHGLNKPDHSILNFFKFMVDEMNQGAAQSSFVQSKKWANSIRTNLNLYEQEIESIQFYSGLCVILKRHNIFKNFYKPIPFQFSISESKMVSTIPEKTRDFAFIIPGKLDTYIYTKEEDYYKDYQRSLYAVTQAKCGWDCMRHYEILANGCIPYFLDLDQCHPNTMYFLPKELIKEAMELEGVSYLKIDHAKFNRAKYDELLKKILEHTKKYLSSRAMAEYLLKSVGYTGRGSILYLTCDHFGIEYMRDFTLIGLKELLQDKVIDYPRVPHIYKDYVRYRPLYGNGFSYTNVVDDYPVNRNNIAERIKNREFEIIIYSISHITLPLYDLVCKYYAPEEIVFICGGEGPLAKEPALPHHCGMIGLFPNLFLREWSHEVAYP